MRGKQNSGGGVPAWLAVSGAGVAGFAAAPPLVQAAGVAGAFGLVLVFALAHGHGMTVRTAAALYAGRAVLALAKAVAVVVVEWPLRGAHRVWVRFDTALRIQLAAIRAGTAGVAALGRMPSRQRTAVVHYSAEVLALPAPPLESPVGAGAVAPPHRHDGTTAA